ncbi:MAG: glycosyltransferase family protein [Calditrichia bacterium]
MKILIGTTEIAGAFDDYRSGYEACGCKVTTLLSKRVSMFQHVEYDYVMEDMLPRVEKRPFRYFRTALMIALRHVFLFYLLMRTDVFHVIWPGNFVKWRFFLPLVKYFNPKLIVLFNPVGDDVRWRQAFIQEGENNGFEIATSFRERASGETIETLKEKLDLLRTFEVHADLICSHPSQAQIEIRPYRYYYLPMQMEHLHYSESNNPVPVIIHASTERAIKGTQLVIDTMEQLKQAGVRLDFHLLERLPNKELLYKLSKADIVIYNPYGRGSGKFGLEALASGCLLFTSYDIDYLPVPSNPPIVHVTPETLAERLKYYLNNPAEMQELRKAGRKWVEDYFAAPAVCQRLLDDVQAIREGKELTYDFVPSFFRDHYFPVFGEKEVALQNNYLDEIRAEPWYEEFVSQGVRNKLKF